MAKPLVSVIIPIYNAEKFLRTCLDSVLKQTLKDLEVICINDGSVDSSLKILAAYSKKDKRIKVITKKNAGVSSARNDGIQASTGRYVHFMDADDYIDIDYYERMFSAGDNNNADIVCSGFVADSKYTSDIKYKKYFITDDLYKKFKITHALTDSYVWRYLIRRDFIIKNKLLFRTDLVAQEDTVFVLTALKHSNCVIVVPNTYYHYIFNSDSALNSRDPVRRAKIKRNYKIGKNFRINFAKENGLMWLWKTRKLKKIPVIGKLF